VQDSKHAVAVNAGQSLGGLQTERRDRGQRDVRTVGWLSTEAHQAGTLLCSEREATTPESTVGSAAQAQVTAGSVTVSTTNTPEHPGESTLAHGASRLWPPPSCPITSTASTGTDRASLVPVQSAPRTAETETPHREGARGTAVRTGSVQEGAMRDGAVRGGLAQEGAAQMDNARDEAAQEGAPQADLHPDLSPHGRRHRHRQSRKGVPDQARSVAPHLNTRWLRLSGIRHRTGTSQFARSSRSTVPDRPDYMEGPWPVHARAAESRGPHTSTQVRQVTDEACDSQSDGPLTAGCSTAASPLPSLPNPVGQPQSQAPATNGYVSLNCPRPLESTSHRTVRGSGAGHRAGTAGEVPDIVAERTSGDECKGHTASPRCQDDPVVFDT